MGSLMAGWDSPTSESDPQLVRLKRNKSLTNEEIDAYWREKKRTEEEHLKAISRIISEVNPVKESTYPAASGVKFQRSSSMPRANTNKEAFMDLDKETSLEKRMKKNPWWTMSNWAFLNEPPVFEGSAKRYASQFHIANLATSKTNADTGISSH